MPEPGCSCSSCRTDAKHHETLLCFFLRWGVGVAMIVGTFTLPGLPHPKPSFLLSRGWVFENFSMSAYGSLLYSRRLKLPFSAFLGIMGTWGKRRMALLHIRAPHTGDILYEVYSQGSSAVILQIQHPRFVARSVQPTTHLDYLQA